MNDVIALGVFVCAYVLIATEWVHRVVVALVGAALMLLFQIVDAHDAFFSEEFGIEWNVIFLLFGMMIIVGVLRHTGVFEYLAIWSAKRAKGRPFAVMALLILITAGASALLDNVTTLLLVAPVTILSRSGSERLRPRSSSPRCSLRTSEGPRHSLVTHRTSSSPRRPGFRTSISSRTSCRSSSSS